MNAVKIFEHPKFGKIRTLIEPDGSPLFCGNYATNALGYSNQRDALKRHCKGVVKRDVPTEGGPQAMNFIPEGDLYRLAAGSELPGANEFESWIFDEVLPSIRRTGTYSLPGTQPHIYPPKATSVGEVAQLLKVLRATMKDNDQPPEIISQMVKTVCDQFGIALPPNFVKVNPFQQLALIGMFWSGQGQLPSQ